jgi:hypothetical protein
MGSVLRVQIQVLLPTWLAGKGTAPVLLHSVGRRVATEVLTVHRLWCTALALSEGTRTVPRQITGISFYFIVPVQLWLALQITDAV